MSKLKLADDLSLPLDTVTQTIAILAKRRAGKSYTMRRLIEQLIKAVQQVVLIDPKGDQWGIRSAADGRAPGLPVTILGGEHGDIPLEPSSGEIIAKLVVEERVSLVLDLSPFRKSEVAKFMTDFLENLYRLKNKEIYRTPMMLVIDEADAIAPQKPQHGEERMLGAAEDIVRRGGQRGIGCILVTQRSAVLNKNVLTQAQLLVALRTIAPQDLAAMKAWIDVHGTPEQCHTLMDSLPSLPIGDAWFWAPGWPTVDGIFKRVHVLPIETFDSGATPKPGVTPVAPKQVAEVDLKALTRQMAATIEKAKADDPKQLQKTIRELRVQVEALQSRPGLETIKEVLIVPDKDVKVLGALAQDLKQDNQQFVKVLDEFSTLLQKVVQQPRHEVAVISQARPWGKTTQLTKTLMNRDPVSRGTVKVSLGEMSMLRAVAQYPDGVTREQLTVLTGYKRSSRDTYLQRLMQAGEIMSAAGLIQATPSGLAVLGPSFEPLPTGIQLQDYWKDRLKGGERVLLEILVRDYPRAVEREALSDQTGYKRSSRDTFLQRLAVRRLITTERGSVRASDLLFD